MTNFEINKIVNSLKFEIRKLFNEKLNIQENCFSLIAEYAPEKVRSINFDNAKNSTIYKLKTNFVEDKLNLTKEIIYDSNINGFYVFNRFLRRDALLTENSFPIIETLDISLKIRSTEFENESIITSKLINCLEVVSEAVWNIQQYTTRARWEPFKEIKNKQSDIIDFDDLFSTQKHITKDKKIEEMMNFYDFLLIKNWKMIKSDYFNDWFEDGADKTYKILFKYESNLYDLGFINMFKEYDLINIVLNWNNILLIIFENLKLEKILNIPKSLISTEDKHKKEKGKK